ncbi:hypothetical protein PIB30_066567 [Stylosanthes scabra]|uniref:Uncharacterized protein n=1 Tax=Stylosanthes scabra TaxID=79078 RepID=A0ABU6RMJ1_9FABA|nr:hypothetical protein [Stylosanthes scabra]
MAKVDRLVGSDDEDWPWDDSDEEDEEELYEEEEDVEEKCEKEEVASNHEEESKTAEECGKLCIANVFEEGKADKPILPVKCEDLGPCLRIWGLCQLKALRKMSMSIRNSKGGTPQVLLGRPFLKTTGFQLNYITETFSFKVGNVEETFHPVRPPASSKKNAHQVQLDHEGKSEEKRAKALGDKPRKARGRGILPLKQRRRKRCASVDDLIDKLKAFKGALHNNKELNTHLVQDHSKWKYEKNKEKERSFGPCTCRATVRVWRIRAIPWRVRTVTLVAFGRSCNVTSRQRAPQWRPRTVPRARTIPWCDRAMALITFGRSYQVASRRRALEWRRCALCTLARCLGAYAPEPWMLSGSILELSRRRGSQKARSREPISDLFGPPIASRRRALLMARPRDAPAP